MKWTPDEFTGKRFGKYEVLCRLAVGGMAELFLGFARVGPFVGRPVVIKRILTEQREDPLALQMLVDEAKMTATLSHPNVAQVMDLESAGGEVLLVIEFITGATIDELVEALAARQEVLPLGFAITVIGEAAQGLAHAHAHKGSRGERVPIIHRDVSPRNVMVNFNGAIKVLDFGIARAKGSERRTRIGMVRGTTAYMSPEQAIGKELDPRTDLFSLGTIFHELLTGQRLFYRGNPADEMGAVYEGDIPLPSRVNRQVPPHLDGLVMRLLERPLERRYQTAREFLSDLAAAAGSMAWEKERCAELVRGRFSARRFEIDKLFARIPSSVSSQAEIAAGPTQQIKGPVAQAAPGPDRPPRVSAPERRSPAPSPARSPPPGDASVELEVEVEATDPAQRTRIMQPVALRSPATSSVEPVEVSQPRRRRPREGARASPAVLIVATGLALLLGGAGGALIFRSLQPPASLVRVLVAADRPAMLWLGARELGTLPISVFLPSGRYQLELQEPAGPRRLLDVELNANQGEANVAVTLDSLPELP